MARPLVMIDHRRFKRDARKMQRALVKLGRESRARTVLAKSLRPAASPINKAAKANARGFAQSGLLWKSIGIVVRRYKATGQVLAVIGPRRGFKQTVEVVRNPTKYAHLVEFGTKHSRAKPFLRPAYDSNRRRAMTIFRSEFWKHFRKEVARVRMKRRAA